MREPTQLKQIYLGHFKKKKKDVYIFFCKRFSVNSIKMAGYIYLGCPSSFNNKFVLPKDDFFLIHNIIYHRYGSGICPHETDIYNKISKPCFS